MPDTSASSRRPANPWLRCRPALGFQRRATGKRRRVLPEHQKRARQSAADAFLLPVIGRPNLTVWSQTTARRLLFDGDRVTGVELRREGRVERVSVAREVGPASGVIESPKLLMLSGIGPAAALKALGIQPLLDAAEVGANLHYYPRVSLRWASQRPLAGSSVSAGLLVHPQAAGAPANEAATTAPDLQFYVGRGLDAVDEFHHAHHRAQPPPQSWVPDSAVRRIQTTCRSFARGISGRRGISHALVTGVQLARSLAGARAYAAGGCAARRLSRPRTCRASRRSGRMSGVRGALTAMLPARAAWGRVRRRVVVYSELRVRGVQGVRVADGSVMPVSVNSQTHAACVMIGERAAQLMLAPIGRGPISGRFKTVGLQLSFGRLTAWTVAHGA